MFSITYTIEDNVKTETTNDIKDLVDIALSLVDDPFVEPKIGNIAGWMNWGDVFKTSEYEIECYNEHENKLAF